MFGRLKHLRDNWNDEIPEETIHFGEKKVRRAWFQEIVANLENGILDGTIEDPQKQNKANQFIEKYTSQDFIEKPLTSESDIEAGDNIILEE